MPKFLLIDQSLQEVGGHHFEYALQVLKAAEQAGFAPHLAAHRSFRAAAELPPHWPVRSIYRHQTYSRFRFEAPDSPPRPLAAARRTIDWWLKSHGRQRRIRSFAANTAELFHEFPLAAGDQVFVATLSELELLGLGKFLSQLPPQRGVDWHVQFHFPIYSGCEPDYAAQDKLLSRLRSMMRQAMSLAAGHRIHLYTTSEPLEVQFNRLGIGPFHTLPYPVNPALRQLGLDAQLQRPATPASSLPSSPLRITCLGGVRREKGYHLLPTIIDRLWDDYLSTGRARFHVQSDFDFSLSPAPENRELVAVRTALGRFPRAAVTLLDEPLASDDYCRLTAASDIGLLPYDRRIYHARCSGVLVELLAAGVPVVVPAGCWMADQLAAPNREYHLSLCNTRHLLGRQTVRPCAAVPIPVDAAAIALLLRWPSGAQICTGAYARVKATFSAADGTRLACRPAIVGPARPGQLSTALLHVPHEAASVAIEWQNAYGPQRVDFSAVEVCNLASDDGRPPPLGVVGLTAVDAQQFPELLAEMIERHDHYLQTAQAQADVWSQWYSPDEVVRQLTAHAAPAKRNRRPAVPKPHLRIGAPTPMEFSVAQTFTPAEFSVAQAFTPGGGERSRTPPSPFQGAFFGFSQGALSLPVSPLEGS